MADYLELLPLGPDDTQYRLVTTEGVSTFETPAGTFLKVDPSAITALTAAAMHDIAHFLRSDHLAQLRKILDDPEASDNDRFVALDLLKNASIAAGGILPMCQDTGTNLPAEIKVSAVQGDAYKFLFIAKGGGSANKSYLFQETKALLNEQTLLPWLFEKMKTLGTAACPPYHLAVVIGGTSARFAVETPKLARTKYFDHLPTSGNKG